MSLILYTDENVPFAIPLGLRRRGIEVWTVLEEGQGETPDTEILDRALINGWVVFTMDEDFLTESRSRTDSDVPFAGVIYSPMSRWPIRRLIDDLELLARVLEPSDMSNRVEYLPLKPP